ncbi:MAG: magnesium transporter [Magnetococcales bacterium]|nr:magnesium transporter [Magnetococcales bacterium]
MSAVVLSDEENDSNSDSSVEEIGEAIERLHRKGASFHLTRLLTHIAPGDIAQVLNGFHEQDASAIYALVTPPDRACLVFKALNDDHKRYILSSGTVEHALGTLGALSPEMRISCINALNAMRAKRILRKMSREDPEGTFDLLNYLPGSAGRLMSPHVFHQLDSTTAAATIQALQDLSEHKMVFYVYVVDGQKRLIGTLSMRQLIMAAPEKTLREIMNPKVIKATTRTPQLEVARQATTYRLLAVPVVDDKGILVGRITIDDLIQVINEENSNTMLKMAGSSASKGSLLTQSPFFIFGARVPWLITAFLGYLAISMILGEFEETLSAVVQLAFFFPIVIGMSGNSGTQTSTIVIRGMALGQIRNNHFFKLLWKELGANIVQGVVYGSLLAVAAYVIFQNLKLSLTVGPAMMCNMIASSVIAMSLPFFFKKMGADPAIAAGPLALTIIDLVGSTNYLLIAHFVFNLSNPA